MARIDRFIEAAFARGAESILVASGERGLMFDGAKSKPFTTQPASLEQVRGLLAEIASPGSPAASEEEGEFELRYDSPSGPMKVSVNRTSHGLQLEITNLRPGEAPAVPPSPPAGATPAPVRAPSFDPGATRPAGDRLPPLPPAARAPGAAPGSGKMETLLRRLVSERGSDLHLSSGSPPYVRKDGSMVAWQDVGTHGPEQVRALLEEITGPKYRGAFDESGDTDYSYEIPGFARFRCNLFKDRLGPGAVFRVIPVEIPTAEQLNLPKAALDLCDLPKGLVLVTGPTGSGKSTTLAAMIDHINKKHSAHIITIEDPIEFIHQNRRCLINQREVGIHTSGFKSALRAALREDPDIVLVGELRDLETIAIALETAETGHLVFGTLHTNTAPSTVDRIIEVFPAERQNQIRAMLSESLKGVIAQTLCKKKGGGRVAAQEILLVTPAISNLIREGKTFQIPTMMQTGRGLGMITMNDALVALVTSGVVDREEAISKSPSRTELRASLDRPAMAVAGAGR